MNPLRIYAYAARGLAEYIVDNTIAMAEIIQLALIATRRRP